MPQTQLRIHTHQAPRLYDSQGNYRGQLTTNPYAPDSTSNPYGRYGIIIHRTVPTVRGIPITLDRSTWFLSSEHHQKRCVMTMKFKVSRADMQQSKTNRAEPPACWTLLRRPV